MLRIASVITFIILLLTLVFLAYLNSDRVYFDYIIAKAQIPLSVLLFLSFLLGLAVSTLSYISLIFLQKRKIAKLSLVKSVKD